MNEEDGKIRKTDEGTGVIEEEKKEEEKEERRRRRREGGRLGEKQIREREGAKPKAVGRPVLIGRTGGWAGLLFGLF